MPMTVPASVLRYDLNDWNGPGTLLCGRAAGRGRRKLTACSGRLKVTAPSPPHPLAHATETGTGLRAVFGRLLAPLSAVMVACPAHAGAWTTLAVKKKPFRLGEPSSAVMPLPLD